MKEEKSLAAETGRAKKGLNSLTLSIVIPAYNEEHHLAACLDSVARQTTPPDEVIVVDNNSTDATATIAKRYPFVTLLKEKKQSVVFARDRGFNAAKADIIGRIDADTILPDYWVATVLKLLDNPKFAGVTGPVGYYDMPRPKQNYWIDHQIRLRLYRGAPHVPFLFGSNSALRRFTWEQIRDLVCHEKDIHEDLDLAIHLARVGTIRYDHVLLAGTSARRYDDSLRGFSQYMKMYRDTYTRHGISSITPRMATSVYWLGYLILQPFRHTYDPVTKRHSLRYALTHPRPRARKNPMY